MIRASLGDALEHCARAKAILSTVTNPADLRYNMIKKQMQGDDPTYRTTSSQHLLAAAEASTSTVQACYSSPSADRVPREFPLLITGAITAMATNPIWVVKTRVFATGRRDPAYSGLWRETSRPMSRVQLTTGALRTIYTREGIQGLYKGSLLALVGVSNGSIQFAAYESIKRYRADLKRKLYEKQGKEWRTEDEKLVSLRVIMFAGHPSSTIRVDIAIPRQH